jgi:hypothetical protein
MRMIGLTTGHIAKMIGVTHHSISDWTLRHGKRRTAGQPTDEEVYEAARIAAKFALRGRNRD